MSAFFWLPELTLRLKGASRALRLMRVLEVVWHGDFFFSKLAVYGYKKGRHCCQPFSIVLAVCCYAIDGRGSPRVPMFNPRRLLTLRLHLSRDCQHPQHLVLCRPRIVIKLEHDDFSPHIDCQYRLPHSFRIKLCYGASEFQKDRVELRPAQESAYREREQRNTTVVMGGSPADVRDQSSLSFHQTCSINFWRRSKSDRFGRMVHRSRL